MVKVGADTKEAESGLDRVKGKVGGFGASLKGIAQQASSFAMAMGGMKLIGQVFDAVSEAVVGFNAHMEQSKVAWTTILGSAAGASVMLKDLQEFAVSTPFEFPQLEDAARRLLAMGFAAKDVVPMLTDVGNTASALGLGTEGVQRITTALGQMQAKTKVSGEEMRQLTETGLPAWQILADAMGKPVSKVQETAGEGKIAAGVFIDAFREFSQANYGGMMDAQSKTFSGAMSNIKDGLTQLMASAFKPLFERISELAQAFANLATEGGLAQWAERIAGVVGNLIALFDQLSAPVQQGIVLFAGLAAAVAVVAPVVSMLAPVISALAGPIGLIAAAVAALYVAWQSNFGGIRDTVMAALPGIAGAVRSIVARVVGFFAENLPKPIAIGQTVWKGIQSLWAKFGDSIAGIVGMLLQRVQELFQTGLNVVGDVIDIVMSVVQGDWAGAWEAVRKLVYDVWAGIIDFLASSAKTVIRLIGMVAEALGKEDLTKGWEDAIDNLATQAKGLGVTALQVQDAIGGVADAQAEQQRQTAEGNKLIDDWAAKLQGFLTPATKENTGALDAEGRAALNAAQGLGQVGSAAEDAQKNVGALISSLVLTHPASLAATAAVTHWQAAVEGVNGALRANQAAVKAAQAEVKAAQAVLQGMQERLQGMQDKLQGLNDQLAQAKQRLQELSQPQLTGMGQFDMQIGALQAQMKRLDLAESLGVPLDKIIKKYPLLTEGAEKYLKKLPKTKEELQKQLEQLQLMQSLSYDEKLKLLQQAANPLAPEMSYEGALSGIRDTQAQMAKITAEITAQEQAISRQQAAIKAQEEVIAAQMRAVEALQAAGEALNETLRTYQEQLQGVQRHQGLVNEGLETAYKWFLEDREKMLEMGGAAAEQVPIIDEKMRELLSGVNQFAGDTSAAAQDTLSKLIDSARLSSATAVAEIDASLGQIPSDIYTYHHVITVADMTPAPKPVYNNAAAAGVVAAQRAAVNAASSWLRPEYRAGGGSVWPGRAYIVGEKGPEVFVPSVSGAILPSKSDGFGAAGGDIYIDKIIVQGSVTTARGLASEVRDELLKMKARNGSTGL